MSRGKKKKLNKKNSIEKQKILKGTQPVEIRSFLRNMLKKARIVKQIPRPNKIQANWRNYQNWKRGITNG
ncbi:MAG: hypothetical protein ACFFC1_18535 [Promethearchaeota archaeon]